MPLDFRYHLASLAAVFCALIIGLLLGVALKEGPALRDQIAELNREFIASRSLRTIDASSNEFNARTQRLLLRGRLYGRNVILVSNPVSRPNQDVEAVYRALEDAKANITARIVLKPALKQLTLEQAGRIYTALNTAPPDADFLLADLMKRLGGNLGTGSPSLLINALSKEHLISVTGDPTAPSSVIVFLGGATEKENFLTDIDTPFLSACTDRGLTVAATEAFTAPVSLIRQYRRSATITIDNIDRAAGRITLVLTVSAGDRGDFGYKETADEVVPEVN